MEHQVYSRGEEHGGICDLRCYLCHNSQKFMVCEALEPSSTFKGLLKEISFRCHGAYNSGQDDETAIRRMFEVHGMIMCMFMIEYCYSFVALC
jgi:hypothetical protein